MRMRGRAGTMVDWEGMNAWVRHEGTIVKREITMVRQTRTYDKKGDSLLNNSTSTSTD